MSEYSPSVRWLEREVFATNPALDQQRLRALLTLGGSPRRRQANRQRRSANGANATPVRILFELLEARRKPGKIPARLLASFDDGWNRALARLVLDDVLRLRTGLGFVGGPRAHRFVFRGARRAADATGHAARLSSDVLESVVRLPITDADELARALYLGHCQPVTPVWRRRFPSAPATRDALVTALGSAERRWLARWTPGQVQNSADSWLFWSQKRLPPARASSGVSYKLYISPSLPSVKEAFRRCVAVFADLGVAQFKIGSGVYALARPDKFVAYFRTRDEVDACSRVLGESLSGLDAHGVPFCGPADDAGLLWWGVDFYEAIARTARDEQTSWRMWVCQRLAASIVHARREPPPRVTTARFALDRLALDGVNPHTFAPSAEFLREAAFTQDGGGRA